MSRLTRRQFLRVTSSAAAGAVLLGVGCAPQSPVSPTSPAATSAAAGSTPAPIASATTQPTATALPATATTTPLSGAEAAPAPAPSATPSASAPTVTSLPSSRADLMRIFPAVPSRVARIHHGGVWDGDNLSPDALGQMLDAALTRLTGLSDAGQAWKTLFDPGERIVLKVNSIMGSITGTHVPLVTAITDRLRASGVPAAQITVYDRNSSELQAAGFEINHDGPGVHCYGTDGNYSGRATVTGQSTRLSDILMQADALINVPLVKQHGITGFSFALKNHYGTINNPSAFHSGQPMRRGLAGISAQLPIKDKTRLIIGDALTLVLGNGWDQPIPADSIFMSFDPIAIDTLALRVMGDAMTAQGRDPTWNFRQAGNWLASGVELGLGTNDPAQMNVVEEKVT